MEGVMHGVSRVLNWERSRGDVVFSQCGLALYNKEQQCLHFVDGINDMWRSTRVSLRENGR